MSYRTSTIVPGLVGALLIGASFAVCAAVPVEESVATGSRSAPPQQGQAIDSRDMSGDSGRLSELFYQLQLLQQEVQELRGMVEEQNHRVERLARDQQEQYLDLDRRMQAVRGGGGATAAAPSGTARAGGPDADGGPAAGTGAVAGAASSGSGSEREVYTAAFDLMKQRRFDESTRGFKSLIEQYPNGAYTPNAFYWLGELYLAQDDYEQARQSFAQVVNLYPDHQKVPDALYKLGVAYHRLGDTQRAREYLNRVRTEYPQSSAAGLAQTYLAEL